MINKEFSKSVVFFTISILIHCFIFAFFLFFKIQKKSHTMEFELKNKNHFSENSYVDVDFIKKSKIHFKTNSNPSKLFTTTKTSDENLGMSKNFKSETKDQLNLVKINYPLGARDRGEQGNVVLVILPIDSKHIPLKNSTASNKLISIHNESLGYQIAIESQTPYEELNLTALDALSKTLQQKTISEIHTLFSDEKRSVRVHISFRLNQKSNPSTAPLSQN